MPLTDKQRQFCLEYIVDLNKTQAAIRAGYSPKTAGAIGEENLKKPEIRSEITRLQEERSHRTQITADRVLEEIACLANSRITDVVSFSNSEIVIKDSKTLPDWVAANIQEIGQINVGRTTKTYVKMHDKKMALKLLVEHLGLNSDFNKAIATLRNYGLVLRPAEATGKWEVVDAVADTDTVNTETDSGQQESDR